MSYNNISELFNMAEERDVPLSQIILETESALTECSYDDIYKEMERRYEVMKSSAKNALFEARKTAGGLIEGITKTHYDYTVKGDTLSGDFINKVMARALSCSEVNASMGKICAAPTAGSCGIIPAVIISLEEALNLTVTNLSYLNFLEQNILSKYPELSLLLQCRYCGIQHSARISHGLREGAFCGIARK